ncbi:oligosaccharide flippase family protein [Aestuariibacter sp. A3R04]|uniref:oligosaccharide flippase family protein n=1 Tax=Aestuariibacter sp. A3R04 TaxID=2841571 RepID=UPI001C0A4D78|nr:oligosaccharide flippase family protein [Aestuariibacter sp. A3R04]MBU3020860.1 oligosaccharide flippase family protein [Aestuariibacter sp. A3R04]
MSLKAKSLKGAFFNLSANGAGQLVNFVVYAIMARILGVEEFGLVAICLMVVDFCNLFVTVGVSQNLIQRKHWDTDFANASFWFLIEVSLAITLLMFTIAVPIAWYTYSELAAQLIAALAIIPLTNSMRLVPKAKMERDFANKRLAAYDTAGVVVGGLVSVATALTGFGAWAIIFGKIIQTFVATLLTWYGSAFRPQWTRGKHFLPEIFQFAKPLIGMSFLNFFSQRTSNIIIAAFLGASTFAYTSVARQGFSVLNNLTFQPLNRIALAGLSRVTDDTLPLTFSRVVSMTALFVTPVYFGVGAVAHPFIAVVFGDKWVDSAYLLSILALQTPCNVMAYYLPSLLIARGLPNQAFKLNLINLIFNFALPLAAVPWGLFAVIAALVVANYITLLIKFTLVQKVLNIRLKETISQTWMFTLSGALMFAAVLFTERSGVIGTENPFIVLPVLVSLGAALYGGTLLLFFRGKTLAVIREFKTQKKTS